MLVKELGRVQIYFLLNDNLLTECALETECEGSLYGYFTTHNLTVKVVRVFDKTKFENARFHDFLYYYLLSFPVELYFNHTVTENLGLSSRKLSNRSEVEVLQHLRNFSNDKVDKLVEEIFYLFQLMHPVCIQYLQRRGFICKNLAVFFPPKNCDSASIWLPFGRVTNETNHILSCSGLYTQKLKNKK